MRTALFFLLVASLFLPLVALASLPAPDAITDFGPLFSSVISFVWMAFVTASVIFFILAGIAFFNAKGNPAELEKARAFVIWGAVGIIVAMIGYTAVQVIQDFLIPPPPPP